MVSPSKTCRTNLLQVDYELISAGGGFYAVTVESEVRIESPDGSDTIILPIGTPLVCGAVVDFKEVVVAHLTGRLAQSDLRLGVAIMLGISPDDSALAGEARSAQDQINRWLGALTTFHFWSGRSAPPMAQMFGFFDDVARSWATRNGGGPMLN